MPEQRYKFDAVEHVHTLDGRPLIGASTVGGVLAKPLTWWAAGLALMPLGWTKQKGDDKKAVPKEIRLSAAAQRLDQIRDLSPEEYLALLDKGYRAHADTLKSSAITGTDRHAIVEKWVKHVMTPDPVDPIMSPEEMEDIKPFIEWAKVNVKKFLWSELHGYSEKYWVGGISDIGCELNDGTVAIIDIKSSKEAYASQFFQCGGYDIIISENGGFDAEGNKIFDLEGKKIGAYIIFPFGMKEPTGIKRLDVENNREAFLAELLLHKQLQAYE